jgi:hypothetical protein
MDAHAIESRCPRLGHEVTLAYCYRTPEGRPCGRLFLCWEGRLPRLRSVVARLLTPEEWRQCFEAPPSPKVATLVDLIQKVRERNEHCP